MSYADIWDEVWRVARKEHYCISGLLIKKGVKYLTISCLYDGGWSNVKLHPEYKKWLDKLNENLSRDCQYSPFEHPNSFELDFEDLASLVILWRMNGNEGRSLSKCEASFRLDMARKDMEIEKLEAEIRRLKKGNE